MLKSADEATLEDRIRAHRLALGLVAVSQGVAFFHAGDNILRSKSLDRDSYNSGMASAPVVILHGGRAPAGQRPHDAPLKSSELVPSNADYHMEWSR